MQRFVKAKDTIPHAYETNSKVEHPRKQQKFGGENRFMYISKQDFLHDASTTPGPGAYNSETYRAIAHETLSSSM